MKRFSLHILWKFENLLDGASRRDCKQQYRVLIFCFPLLVPTVPAHPKDDIDANATPSKLADGHERWLTTTNIPLLAINGHVLKYLKRPWILHCSRTTANALERKLVGWNDSKQPIMHIFFGASCKLSKSGSYRASRTRNDIYVSSDGPYESKSAHIRRHFANRRDRCPPLLAAIPEVYVVAIGTGGADCSD